MANLLVWLLIFSVAVYIAFWILDHVPLPHPLNWLARAVVAIAALAVLAQKFLPGHVF